MRGTRRVWLPRNDPHLMRFVRAVSITGAVALVIYVAILWNFGLDPLRTALGNSDLAGFYDLQARALFDGRLDVPRDSLGIEGFINHGREYMYFPPGPSLARMPLLLFTSRFDGRLTAVSMLIAFVVTLVLTAALMWRVRRVLRGRAPLPQWEAWSYAGLLMAASVGSVQLYLGSMPWVYHEAYAWSIACAVGGAFALLGVIERPSARRAAACGVVVLAAIMVRSPTGWALGLGTIATGLWFLSGRHTRRAWRFSRLLIVAGAAPLVVGAAINWAKFDSPVELPMDKQVWSSVNEQRAAALEANGGDLVSFDLLPSTLMSYFRPDGIRFVAVPPFVTFPATPATSYGGFLDQTYRTGSVIPFMPALVALGIWGLVTVFRPRGPSRAYYLRIPVLATGAICGVMLIWAYISYRYVSELLPILILASAIGLVDLGHLLSLRSDKDRTRFLGGLWTLAAFGVFANGAVGLTAESLANPGPALDRYLSVQESVSKLTPGNPLVKMTSHSDRIPRVADGEHLHIVGDCAALLVGQAETYWPWVAAELRPLQFDFSFVPPTTTTTVRRGSTTTTSTVGRRDGGFPTPELPFTRVELAHSLDQPGRLVLDLRPADRAYRVSYRSPTEATTSGWKPIFTPTISIRVEPDIASSLYEVRVADELLMLIPIEEFDDDWFRFQNLLVPSERDANGVKAGIVVRQVDRPAPERCSRLLRQVED